MPSNHGFGKYFTEPQNQGLGETYIQGIAQHAYDIAVKENKVHPAFSELGIMVQSAKGIMKEIACLNPNEIFHIMAEKHAWAKVVKDASNWDEIAKIMTRVMREGAEGSYKGGALKRALKINEEVIEVIFKMDADKIKISNGWIVK